jgi:sulfite reductase beta subunit-like hemoprotein
VAADPGEVELQAVSEPPTSSWISRAMAARSALDAGLQVLGQFRQALARAASSRSAAAGTPRCVVGLDGVLQRRRQPGQVALQQVVAGAVAHGGHGRVLADLARHQDEGHGAITALQFQDMASQLIAHTRKRLRNCADRLARDAMGDDEDGEAVVEKAPLRPNPVTQDEMDAGSIELF